MAEGLHHSKGGSQVKMNLRETEEEMTATTLGSPKGWSAKTQQQVK